MSYQFLKSYMFKSGITVKNRIVVPPMTESMSFTDGSITQDELHYFKVHSGGAGLFVTPVANVNALGKGFEGELSVADDSMIPGLSQLAKAIKQDGTKAILQIFNAGRMTNRKILRGEQPVSASAIAAVRPNSEIPRALSEAEIEQIIQDFADATVRAIKAGFDGIELHGANTYLIQQFFSPHSNQRHDEWGGSLEKRMNFPLAIIRAAQDAIRDNARRPFMLGYRLSPEEIEKPGITIEDTLALVKRLDTLGLDYLHISMGSVWRTSLNDKNDQEPLIIKIKDAVQQTPIITVGGVETPADAESVIKNGFDFVALGRESIREPAWVQKVENGTEDTIRYRISVTDLNELGIPLVFFKNLLEMEQNGAHIGFVPDVGDVSHNKYSDIIFN